jgi:hypothetical protein
MATQGGMGLEIKVTVTSTLTAIGHLLPETNWPKVEKILSEETGHDALNGYAEWKPTGKYAVGTFTLIVLWDPSATTHAALNAAFDSQDDVAMLISSPNGNEAWTFVAQVKSLGPSSKQDQGFRMAIDVQPTGYIDRTAGSGS